jgi:hypothetical protein
MKKILLAILVSGLSLTANADQWGAYGGLNTTEYDGSASFDREIGLEAGATYHYDMGNMIVRTGAGYVQKNSSVGPADFELSYIEIPATGLWFLNDAVGIIGGANVDVKVGDDCSVSGGSCSVNDAESLVLNLVGGAHYKVNDVSRIEGLLEFVGLTDVATDTEIGNSLSARYVHMF